MSFSIGGGSASSKGTGSSSSTAQSTSDAFNLSGSESGGISGSTGLSTARSGSKQDLAFSALFGALFGGASTAAGLAAESPFMSDSANMLFGKGTSFLDNLMQQSGGMDPASQHMMGAMTGQDGRVQQNIDLLGRDLGLFLQNEAMPGIADNSIRAGGLGGGRQGVAQGVAIGQASDAFSRGAADIYNQDLQRRDQAAMGLQAGMMGANTAGLAGLPGVLGMAEAQQLSGLNPYMALSQIMGGPTTLTESFGTSDAMSESFANQYATSFGFGSNTAQSTSESQSQQTSKSKDRKFSLGF